jgi:hypothetical protein
MGELIKALEKFLMRDLVFVVGGSLVLLSFLAAFDRFPKETTPTAWYLLGAGLAYAVGYAIQETSVILRVVRTKAGVKPGHVAGFLYRRFERSTLTRPVYSSIDYEKAKKILLTQAPKRRQDDHERTESLKQVGNTLGPCLLLAGIILAVSPLLSRINFRIAVAAAAIVLGLILICCGLLKVTQQAQYIFQIEKTYGKTKDDIAESVEKLMALRDNGILTEEEFQTKRRELLNRP